MHDRNGTELKVGDVVTIRYLIIAVMTGTDYFNIPAESVEGRKPDGMKEHFSGNTAVCVLQERATQ